MARPCGESEQERTGDPPPVLPISQSGGDAPVGTAGKAVVDKRLEHAAELLARFG